MPFHILWSINLYETRQKRGWPVVKQRKKEGTSTIERVLAPLRNGTHILLLQRRNANLMSFWKYNKGSSRRLLHLLRESVVSLQWKFFRQQLILTLTLHRVKPDMQESRSIRFLGEMTPLNASWLLQYTISGRLRSNLLEIHFYLVFFASGPFDQWSHPLTSNCIFVGLYTIKMATKRSIIHFVHSTRHS